MSGLAGPAAAAAAANGPTGSGFPPGAQPGNPGALAAAAAAAVAASGGAPTPGAPGNGTPAGAAAPGAAFLLSPQDQQYLAAQQAGLLQQQGE